MSRALREIAEEVYKDWGDRINFAAKPWLRALLELETINDLYGMDSGKTCVLYFLSNAQSWRGPEARRIKAELKLLVGVK